MQYNQNPQEMSNNITQKSDIKLEEEYRWLLIHSILCFIFILDL